ncbi:MAG: zinc ribbon domain-containing protein [Nodosilinea sp.]
MPYQYDLGSGQTIYLDNPGPTTVMTLVSRSLGQQQQSGTQIQTGPWIEVPQAARSGNGVLLRCATAQGTFIWRVQGTQIESADAAAWSPHQAEALTLVEVGAPAMTPMPPMEPMAPMKMGNMQMSAHPMTMQMGDMTLSMGGPAPPSPKQFCTQCGAALKAGDRFCGSCGHQIQ